VKAAFAPGEALHDDAGFFIDKDAHDSDVEEAKDAEDVKERSTPIKTSSIPSIDYEA
jgi:hypothetical protein